MGSRDGGTVWWVGGGLAVVAIYAAGVRPPVWLIVSAFVVFFVVGFLGDFLVEFTKDLAPLMTSLTEVPQGTVACPRCGDAPRTSSGWCTACASELATLGRQPVNPVEGFERALAGGKLGHAVRFLADQVTIAPGNGTAQVMSRAHWRRTSWVLGSLYRDGARSIEVSYVDPIDSGVVWVRTRASARGLLKMPSLNVRRVTWYRVSGPFICELRETLPLPLADA